MATPAAFSRLQLAAALLEYDNDPENPDAPYKSAQDSAIFAHLRRNPAARPELASRRSDYLSVALPSDDGRSMGMGGGRESALDTRRSRASKGSIDALHNPFGAEMHSNENSDVGDDEEKDRDGGEEGLEVDLASWGLDAFIPKDKKSAKAKGKQPAVPASVNASRSRLLSNSNLPADPNALAPARRGLITSKSVSLGGDIEANHALNRPEVDRRRSFGSPLDLVGMEPSGEPIHPAGRQRAQSHASLRGASSSLVPFPTAPSVRSPSPGPDQAYASDSMSRRGGNMRTYSMASMTSRMLLPEDDREDDAASRLYPDTASRYDPTPAEDNPFAIQHTTHTSRFDPKNVDNMARARSHSNATMGSRFLTDLAPDNVSTYTGRTGLTTGDPYARERRYSTLELLRPKVLVMPSPLQQSAPTAPAEPKAREGFEISTDGPPLPPGARTSRRLSSTMSLLDAANADPGPVASNLFTPNPLSSLTLSQKTFRNTLAVPGQGSLPYMDGTSALPRATEEGEQVMLDTRDGARPESVVLPGNGLPGLVDPNSKSSRPAGKLYGKSLIDDLEERKATMRSKQRVFTGDQRPSMMARQSTRSSTLIDPASLVNKPEPVGAGLTRSNSVTLKPLLTFDSVENVNKSLAVPPVRPTGSRSVFGVDTLWQREMEKLKEIEKQEEAEREEQKQREAAEEDEKKRKREKKAKRGKIKKRNPNDPAPVEVHELHGLEASSSAQDVNDYEDAYDGMAIPRVSAEPPTLPDIRRASRKPPPKPSDSDVSSDSDDDDDPPAPARRVDAGWNSSDEEDTGPRRTTGVGPRYPTRSGPTHVPMPLPTADSDEEDLPLAAAIEKVRQRHTAYPGNADDSEDEDKPLSRVLQEKTRGGAPSVHNLGLPNTQARRPSANDDEDDDEPLALRASRIPPAMAADDEDEMPLAFHPEQQRRTQYAMLQQQQQQQMAMAQAQQQQMMMQAQLQGNMLMNPGMMSPAFYNPPMMSPMAMMPVQPPMPMPSPPPMHDAAKHSLVDRWRRQVEG